MKYNLTLFPKIKSALKVRRYQYIDYILQIM